MLPLFGSCSDDAGHNSWTECSGLFCCPHDCLLVTVTTTLTEVPIVIILRTPQIKVQAGWIRVTKRIVANIAVPIQSLRSEEHTSELQSHSDLVCRLLLEKKSSWLTRAAAPLIRPSQRTTD